MKPYTRAVKSLLREHYPNIKFSVKYYPVFNYAVCSDRIEIKYSKESDIKSEDIIGMLAENTHGITIAESDAVSAHGTPDSGEIYDIDRNKWIDTEAVEFIIIKAV